MSSKRRQLVVFCIVFIAAVAAPAWGGVYDGWQYRMDLTLDKDAALGSSLTDFPVLVKLNASRTNSYTGFASGGADLRFSQGGVALDYEIEQWNPSGDSYVWVRASSVPAGGSGTITAHWGNGSATDAQNAHGVFSAGYLTAWHLDESGNGTAGEFVNSAADAVHGTGGEGDGARAPDRVAGKIAGGQRFVESSRDFIDAGAPDWSAHSTGAVEAWAFLDVADGSRRGFFRYRKSGTQYVEMRYHGDTGKLIGKIRTTDPGEHFDANADAAAQAGRWYHLMFVQGGTSSDDGVLYIDGVAQADQSDNLKWFSMAASEDLWIGTFDASHASTSFFGGILDEMRVSSTARSADWAKATYLTGDDNFVAYGSPQYIPEPAAMVLLALGGAGLIVRRRR